jgi:hypothetical protein
MLEINLERCVVLESSYVKWRDRSVICEWDYLVGDWDSWRMYTLMKGLTS